MPKIIKEQIPGDLDIREALTGAIPKIQKALIDFENTFKDTYLSIEIDIEDDFHYDSNDITFRLIGFRYETPEEEKLRLEKEEKNRLARLKRLAKSKETIEKKRQKLEQEKAKIEKELKKLG